MLIEPQQKTCLLSRFKESSFDSNVQHQPYTGKQQLSMDITCSLK